MEQRIEWIRTPEAAEYLGVHVETVRRWAREGVIPAAKLGNRGGLRFRREDLDDFLYRRRLGPVPHTASSPNDRAC